VTDYSQRYSSAVWYWAPYFLWLLLNGAAFGALRGRMGLATAVDVAGTLVLPAVLTAIFVVRRPLWRQELGFNSIGWTPLRRILGTAILVLAVAAAYRVAALVPRSGEALVAPFWHELLRNRACHPAWGAYLAGTAAYGETVFMTVLPAHDLRWGPLRLGTGATAVVVAMLTMAVYWEQGFQGVVFAGIFRLAWVGLFLISSDAVPLILAHFLTLFVVAVVTCVDALG
jgi:hypothetical protein